MSCQITTRERGDVTIIDSAGRIALSNNGAANLRDTIRDLAARGRTKIIVNLAETSYVDSCGIGELVSGFTVLSHQNGAVKLLALGKRVKDLLLVTNLHTVFEVFDDEDAAVQSFK